MASRAVICYETPNQLILHVTLEDGRGFSIDIGGSFSKVPIPTPDPGQDILVSGHVVGMSLG